ncbi:MAG: hypothetical protein GY711_17290 [bacterium]|nr:hypothetical protein [bacterium]
MHKLLAPLVLLLASCASIVAGETTEVEVTTLPAGAAFNTGPLGVEGVTPATVELPNGEEVTFYFELEGHEPASFVSDPRMSGWVVGNLLFGGLIGIIIDMSNSRSRIHSDIEVELSEAVAL